MTTLVVAEKPSVARDVAQVLGARTRGEGYLEGSGYVVTWAIGHLVALAEPQDMNPAWKRWSLGELPMLPGEWPLVPVEQTRDQYAVVKKLLTSKDVTDVICATDAGREGELIFRYLYEASRSKKPVQRLWISSLTPKAIADGFKALRPGASFDGLADAARARSRADWLVGMNLSRAYSIVHDDHLSVGRVQTPTLAMLVARELEIRDFVPEDYLEVVATFAPPSDDEPRYDGVWERAGVSDRSAARRLPKDGALADEILARARTGKATIASVERKSQRLPPPQLYDLTELQRHANRLFGFTAQRTLEIAQALYERRKLLSYPRTDSRHLSQAVAATLPAVTAAIAGRYQGLVAPGTGTRPLGLRFVDDAKVSDHHAIIPTDVTPPEDLPPDERKIHDLVCRRLLAAWHDDHVTAVTTIRTEIASPAPSAGEAPVVDRFLSTGTSVEHEGWKIIDLKLGPPPKDPPVLPGGLAAGMPRRVADARALAKQTRPPPRLTDGTLLTAMETAGEKLDEKELSRAMRERGLGTPATRAAILETLLRREYVAREGKTLVATPKGIGLIERVHPHVKSPKMTGEWEAKLAAIERGSVSLAGFMGEIEAWVTSVVGNVKEGAPARAERPAPREAPSVREVPSETPFERRQGSESTQLTMHAPRPERPRDLDELLKTAFGFDSFRPYQRAVCDAATAGHDVLLVMPTGAGKSLCYQLPGLARGGTTLVVSPLIALMEDQVGQLVRRGFSAERIHSGRSRLESRAVCKSYLEGTLDFLFIAPERLRVPGFPEMLARRKPTLIAIDEAHCISQWGHDFRPDYRMLGERLPLLAPAPIIALTATATPQVQDDIAKELALREPERFIHGFRRTNIAVEVASRNPSLRADVVLRVLADPGRRPAIVYAPTRRESEELAKLLGKRHHAAPYHAGMRPDARDDVQTAFLRGKLDVIVATTAFGMGIDKPDVRTVIHTALPASVEGYYQEIGRAGRDGEPSRAILLCSYVDTKTHEFFLERDYPEADLLARIHARLDDVDRPSEDVAARVRVASETFEKALEKLWVHGGAIVDADGNVRRGHDRWRPAYERQRAHKEEQLARMRRFTETATCRMLQLVDHFGDRNDRGTPCGTCDVCDPDSALVLEWRAPTATELGLASRIEAALAERDGRAVGQLHREVAGELADRDALEALLAAMARADRVRLVTDTFDKDGTTITFQRVFRLTTPDELPLRIAVTPESPAGERGRGKRRRKKTREARGSTRERRSSTSTSGSSLETALRAWRTTEAKKRGVPAFRILTDRTLTGIADARPKDEDELLAVSGIGAALLAKYGTALLALVRREGKIT